MGAHISKRMKAIRIPLGVRRKASPMLLSGCVGAFLALWRGNHYGFGWSNLKSGWPLTLTVVALISAISWYLAEMKEETARDREREWGSELHRMVKDLWTTQTAIGVAEAATTEYVNPGIGIANATAKASVEFDGMKIEDRKDGPEEEGDTGA